MRERERKKERQRRRGRMSYRERKNERYRGERERPVHTLDEWLRSLVCQPYLNYKMPAEDLQDRDSVTQRQADRFRKTNRYRYPTDRGRQTLRSDKKKTEADRQG